MIFARGERRGEILAVEFVVAAEVGGVAHVVARLHDVAQRAAGGGEDLAEVFHGAAEFALEGVGHDLARGVDGRLAGDEDKVADAHGGAEWQVRDGRGGIAGIADGGTHENWQAKGASGSSGQTGRASRRHGKRASSLVQGPGVST